MMKKAPYLKIQDKSISIGQEYWQVCGLSPFILAKHVAGSENNVVNHCYFFSELEAIQYQKMCELSKVLNSQIMIIEKRNKYFN